MWEYFQGLNLPESTERFIFEKMKNIEEVPIQNLNIHQNLHAWDEESLQGRPRDLSQGRNHMQIDTNKKKEDIGTKTRKWTIVSNFGT